MIRFKKIKKTSEGKIHLEYEKTNQQGKWDEHSMKSAQQPAPSFDKALEKLIPHVQEMCELPKDDHTFHPYEVRGVSFSYAGENETMGATITATRKLNHSNAPLVLNTPHKIEEPYADGADDLQVMTTDCLIDLVSLQDEAEAYLNGKRKQADLFAEPETAEA